MPDMSSGRKWTEWQCKQWLRTAGVPVVPGRHVASPEAAVDAARELGLPVALKVSHPDLPHKSDAGGVLLGLAQDPAVRQGARQLLALRTDADLLVETMAPEGLDLICGFTRDPVFGPVVMVGLGGIFAELLRDTALFVGTPDRRQALALLDRLQGRPLLHGARGTEAVDRAAVADVLVALGRLAEERPDIAEFDINPLRAYPDRVLALDALAVAAAGAGCRRDACAKGERPTADLSPFFRPRSVAVVGASRNAARAGNIILRNLATLGFQGAVYPVNPNGAEIEGLPAFASVADCPEPPEVAVVAVPYHQVEAVMLDVARAGTRAAIVVSGGFSDADAAGKAREERLLALCRDHGIRLMGPNSIGTLDSRSGFTTSIGTLPPIPPSGASVFGQSGTLSTGFSLEEATIHNRGFARIACLGNKPDIDESDLLAWLGRDEDTRVVGMYIEGVKDGPRFLAAARQAAATKPVFALKSGRTETGARAAASHTGALAGADAVIDAVFRQTGIQRVYSLPELFDALRTTDMCPLPNGPRLGIVSLTGVGCVLAADACGDEGLDLAPLSPETTARLKELVPEWAPVGNPADIWSTIEQVGPAEAYRRVCEVMIADESVDILLVISVLLLEGAFDMGPVLEPLRRRFPHKPILAAWVGGRRDLLDDFRTSLEAVGIPAFEGPERAVRAAAALVRCRAAPGTEGPP